MAEEETIPLPPVAPAGEQAEAPGEIGDEGQPNQVLVIVMTPTGQMQIHNENIEDGRDAISLLELAKFEIASNMKMRAMEAAAKLEQVALKAEHAANRKPQLVSEVSPQMARDVRLGRVGQS